MPATVLHAEQPNSKITSCSSLKKLYNSFIQESESTLSRPKLFVTPTNTHPEFNTTELYWSLYDYLVRFKIFRNGQINITPDFCHWRRQKSVRSFIESQYCPGG